MSSGQDFLRGRPGLPLEGALTRPDFSEVSRLAPPLLPHTGLLVPFEAILVL